MTSKMNIDSHEPEVCIQPPMRLFPCAEKQISERRSDRGSSSSTSRISGRRSRHRGQGRNSELAERRSALLADDSTSDEIRSLDGDERQGTDDCSCPIDEVNPLDVSNGASILVCEINTSPVVDDLLEEVPPPSWIGRKIHSMPVVLFGGGMATVFLFSSLGFIVKGLKFGAGDEGYYCRGTEIGDARNTYSLLHQLAETDSGQLIYGSSFLHRYPQIRLFVGIWVMTVPVATMCA
jgi:hypothetical protein